MEQSAVYGRIHFLMELGNMDVSTRKLTIRHMNRGKMEALSEVIRYIVEGSIRSLTRDESLFWEKRNVLRQLANERISLRRKKNTLLYNHALVPRLVRPYYLDSVLVLSIRAEEQ